MFCSVFGCTYTQTSTDVNGMAMAMYRCFIGYLYFYLVNYVNMYSFILYLSNQRINFWIIYFIVHPIIFMCLLFYVICNTSAMLSSKSSHGISLGDKAYI